MRDGDYWRKLNETREDIRSRIENFVFESAIAQDERGAVRVAKASEGLSVKVKALHDDAVIPKYAHEGDAGFDLVAVEDVIIEPGETALVKTGLAFALPEGFEMQIRPRSGITLKTKLRVQLGTVDSGYVGEVGVIVDNISPAYSGYTKPYIYDIKGDVWTALEDSQKTLFTYIIRKGDRIAQAVINAVPTVNLNVVTDLDETSRGQGGFGSSGVTV